LVTTSRRSIVMDKCSVLVVPARFRAAENWWTIFGHLSDLARQMLSHALSHEPVVGFPENRMSHGPLRSPIRTPRRPPEPMNKRCPGGNERLVGYAPPHDVTSL
jgi:hypothetical protein